LTEQPTTDIESKSDEPQDKRHKLSLRRAFLTGLAALLPTALTAVILVWTIRFVHKYIAGPINNLIINIVSLIRSGDNKAESLAEAVDIFDGTSNRFNINFAFAGYVVAFAAIFLVGFALLTIFGRKLYRAIDRVLSRMPVLKMIYPHLKQLTEFVFADKKTSSFKQVVMIEYPRHGLWSMGFLTGPAMRSLRAVKVDNLVSVFIPSSPTPFTGYVVAVRRDEIVELPITVDQALRFSISGGVLLPPGQGDVTGGLSRPATEEPKTRPEADSTEH